ncbi:MAG: peptidylprolyl isomerase [Pseudomonadota bacterium]
MNVSVNGVTIDAAAIERESRRYEGAPDPLAVAAVWLAVQELLLQRARALGIAGEGDEDTVERLLEREVPVPVATDAECRRYYDGHPERFRHGFHVIEVLRRVEGELAPFEEVRDEIAARLHDGALRRALAQYVQLLAGSARVEGIDLLRADSPLVQ